MPQKPQIVDITKSYLPGDPNAFVQNLVNTDREDGEEKTLPLVPYEGYNFLPTSYGYKSFFGTNSVLEVSTLASRCQFVLLYQMSDFKSRLIALCEDGIWIGYGEGLVPDWIQVVTHTFDADVYEEWTWCVIENVLYMYKQGRSEVYYTDLGTLEVPGAVITLDLSTALSVAEDTGTPGGFASSTSYKFYAALSNDDYTQRTPFVEITGSGFTPSTSSISAIVSLTGVLPDNTKLLLIVEEVSFSGFYIGEIPLPLPYTVSAYSSAPFGLLTRFISSYLTNLSDSSTGDGTFDAAVWEVYLEFSEAVPLTEPVQTLIGTTTPGTAVDVTLNNIPAAYGARIIIREVASSVYWYKDFVAGPTIQTVTNLTGFTEATFNTLPSTLYQEPSTFIANELAIPNFTPSFLNMAGQLGIFKAGLRLGFWDSANSVSWSSNLDLEDLTPSIENLAGNTIFGSVVGRIVHCRGHGEGFVVYSTKSIVGATFSASGNLLWDAKKILDNTGISYSRAVCCGKTDSEHFVFATTGIYTIGKYNALAGKYDAEPVLVEVYDLLKESRDPVYMSVLQDRYLCFSVIDPNYISGKLSFYRGAVNPLTTVIDWYIPSETASTGTEIISSNQTWEIIANLLQGGRAKIKREGVWIPLYNVSIDKMYSRYSAHWTQPEFTDLVAYRSADPFIATITDSLTGGEITTYLDSPNTSDRRAEEQTTYTGVRAFFGQFDSDIVNRQYRNVQSALYAQLDEWMTFYQHQQANAVALASIEDEQITYSAPTPYSVTPVLTDSTTDTAVGSFLSGSGNIETLYTKGPAVDAAREIILRKTFVEVFSVTEHEVVTEVIEDYGTAVNYGYGDLYIDGTTSTAITDFDGYATVPGVSALTITRYAVKRTSDNAIVDYVYAGLYVESDFISIPTREINLYYNYPLVNLSEVTSWNGSNFTNLYPIPEDGVLYKVNLKLRDLIYEGGSGTVIEGTPSYTADYTDFYRVKTTTNTTYDTALVTGQYGYSEMRATVTYWDRIRDDLYGNYTRLERVAASAMTAKVWADEYPTDRGTNRDFILAYSAYRSLVPADFEAGTIAGYSPFGPAPDGAETIPTISGYNENDLDNQSFSFTLPGASFLLQTGSITPTYQTFVGALVFDLHLKKWGKYKGEHKILLETTPINTAVFGTITYSDLGANAGILAADGFIYLFDTAPEDSFIKYGKLGFYRLGMTNLLEVRASMRNPSTFMLATDSSMDGKVIDTSLETYAILTDEVVAEVYIDVSARWHTVKIAGNFDLTGLEVRATLAGRR